MAKTKRPHSCERGLFNEVKDYLTASFRDLPALKAGSFIAGMLIVSLGFLGLTPLRAALLETRKVPKPVIVTLSPFLRLFVIIASTASSTSPAAFFVTPADCAAPATRSPLVMLIRVKEIKHWLL